MLTQLTHLKGEAHRTVISLTMDYLFGVITKREYNRYGVECDLLSNGYVLRNCKLYVYAVNCGLKPKASEYGIDRSDVRLLNSIAQRLQIKGCRSITLEECLELEQALCTELRTYVIKFVRKKMTFLVKSYGHSQHDIVSHLLYCGLLSMLRKYPFYQSSLHLKNCVKAAIHNAGIDYITASTRQKNQRLIKNADGTFESAVCDISNLYDLEAPQPFNQRFADERSSLDSLQNRMNKRGCLFIKLAKGEYDRDFSEYIGLDNTVAAEGNYNAYLKKIQRYLNVNNKQTEAWFEKLRAHL